MLKKVDDGLEEFSDCWDQATSASSAQQKERLGEELKRSINKLQRFRAQIREWLAQSGVQTEAKDRLEEARKKVEHAMQRFKDFERELKTKAFSTCALQRGGEDEEEAEKLRHQDWVSDCIHSLNTQLEQIEADLETLATKKSLSSEDKTKQASLKTLLEHHRWHVKKLEVVLRAIDNDAVDLGELACIRDSIEHYVENGQEESDMLFDDGLYEALDLAEFEEKAASAKVKAVAPETPKDGPSSAGESSTAGKDEPKKAKDKDKRKKDEKKDKKREDKKVLESRSPANSDHAGNGQDDVKAEPEEVKVQEDQLLSEAEEFICGICQIHVAGCGPKLTSCSHLFCGDCIAQWFNQHPKSQTWAQRAKSAGPDRVVPCPVCKQPLSERKDLYPVCGLTSRSENLLLWRMLSSLKIVCVNHLKVRKDGKCDWVGEYGTYQAHALKCKNEPLNAGAHSDEPTTAARVAEPPQPAPRAIPAPAPRVEARQPAPVPAPAPAPVAVAAAPAPVPAPAPVAAAPAPAPVAVAPAPVPKPAAPTLAPSPVVQAASVPAPAPAVAEPVAAAVAEESATFEVRAGVAFEPSGPSQMKVRTGDVLEVLDRHTTGWTYAKNLTLAGVGWIPSWVTSTAQPSVESRPAAPQARRQEPEEKAPEVVRQPSPPRPAAVVVEATPTPVVTVAPVVAAATLPDFSAEAPAAPRQEEARTVLPVLCAFAAASKSQLTLAVAELVDIVERHSSGWTYGRKVSDAHAEGPVEGWFPSWVTEQPALSR